MQKLLMIFMCILILGACAQKENAPPIPKDKLAKVLVDVHFAEAAMQEVPSSIRDSVGRVYYDQIFKIHGIDEETLNESLRIIKKDPEKLEAVYQKVEVELDRQTEALR